MSQHQSMDDNPEFLSHEQNPIERPKIPLRRRCKHMCTTGWTEMRLRSQILLKLVLIIFLSIAFYMVVLVIIFEGYYKPDVLGHFQQELEIVHQLRTSNMTVSVSSRFEAFDRLTRDNVGKVRKLLSSTQIKNFTPKNDLPFEFIEEPLAYTCTS